MDNFCQKNLTKVFSQDTIIIVALITKQVLKGGNMDKIREIWQREAENIPPESGKTPVPARFKVYSLQNLRKKGLLGELVKVYQQIFGEPEIWNEGAFCNREGWSNTISLKQYENRKRERILRCECGGIFQPCYPTEVLEARIIDELADPKRTALWIMEGENEFKIGGFLWGVVTEFEEIERRILNARYRERGDRGLIEIRKLNSRLKEKGVLLGDFLYGDEMALLKPFRQGLNHLYLIRLWVEFGHAKGTRKALFWTSKKSPLFKLSLCYGCEIIHTTEDGIYFFLHPAFESPLKVLQYGGEERLKRVLVKASQVLKSG